MLGENIEIKDILIKGKANHVQTCKVRLVICCKCYCKYKYAIIDKYKY